MIAVNIGNSGAFNDDIWIYDIGQSVFNRFTFGNGNLMPVWRRDGSGIYFSSGQSDIAKIQYKSIDGQSSQTILEFSTTYTQYPIAISPDDRFLILNRVGGTNEGDLLQIDLSSKADPEYIFQTPIFEYGADISPDGKYMAYGANETGRLEIFIKTFPEEQGKWQISTQGGISPRWAPDGRELYYINTVGKFMGVPIQHKPFFSPGKAKELFDVAQMNFPITPLTNFDVTPDGQKFLMVRNLSFRARDTAFNIVTNWLAEVENRLSEK
jgi:Tol biopolymer transport system component